MPFGRDQNRWVEAWLDQSAGDYVLLVRETSDGAIEVVDPQDRRRVIKTFRTYDEAGVWLAEDEYVQIEGRWLPND